MGPNGVYRRIIVPLRGELESERAMRVACGLAADRGASIAAVAVILVPPLLPLDAHMDEEEEDARKAIHRAQTIADSFGVPLTGRILRARAAANAIVGQAESLDAEVVVLGAERSENGTSRVPAFGKTAGAVLKGAPCRVVLVSVGGNDRFTGYQERIPLTRFGGGGEHVPARLRRV